MDFDFPIINDLPPSTQPSQTVSMHNLLNATSQSQSFNNTTRWAQTPNPPHLPPQLPSHLPPPPLHPPQLAAKRSHPTADAKQEPNKLPITENLPIDAHAVDQMGGLAYADLCKERAREQFKEMKKNEHMANGDYDRIRRRKKGDTSMNSREKYVRRLRMNQDSAAAARHAQEIYVHVLERLVKTGEDEKKAMGMEVGQLRQEVSRLRQHNSSLNTRVSQLEATNNAQANPDPHSLFDGTEKRFDTFHLAKMVDMLTAPEPTSAQAQDRDFAEGRMGIQPSRAV